MSKKSRFYQSFVWIMLLILVVPVLPAHADAPLPSSDVDGDGLSNDMETAGWYNLAGGPFVTDPLDADSDNDGLGDGEEKLYGTDPVDNTDPGIYVRYEDSFKTKQYFSPSDEMEKDEWGNWIRKYLPVLQGGDQYLMTEAMVVRRGATFHISGPEGANLAIDSTGLSTLTPVFDTCTNSWAISVPITRTTSPLTFNTVGTYTATMTLPDLTTQSMLVHVIFELPGNMTAEEIAGYLYDDDPANKRDEVSVWWRTPEWSYYSIPPNWPPYNLSYYSEEETAPNPWVDCSLYPTSSCSNWQFHHTYGYAQAFWTEQFTQKVFVNHAMPAIRGKTTQAAAVYTSGSQPNDLIDEADKEFRTVYVNTNNSWSTAMRKVITGTNWTMNGGACQDNANVYVTLLRSAGIPAKPFLEDYNKTIGHGDSGQLNSNNPCSGTSCNAYEYDHAVMLWLDSHWKISRSYNGEEKGDAFYPFWNGRVNPREIAGFYGDYAADLIVSTDHRWDWQDESNGGGMVNTVWDDQAEGVPSPEFAYPNNNWDIDWNSRRPLEIKQSPYAVILNYESWYGDGWAPGEWRTNTITTSNRCLVGSAPYEHCSNPNGTVVDVIPPGRVATQTYATLSGVYTSADSIENWPYNPQPTQCSPSAYENDNVNGTPEADCEAMLSAGEQSVEPQEEVVSGPSASETDLNTLKGLDARFTDVFTHQGIDTDGDGDYDSLTVYADLEISIPGAFTAEGDLYDARGALVGHAEWAGSSSPVSLEFHLAKARPPYTLEHLYLYKASGELSSSRFYKAYEITDLVGRVDQGAISIASLPPTGDISAQAVTSTLAFTVTPQDTNGNGSYDKLNVNIGVTSDGSGAYRVEGLLVDQYDNPVAWSVSDAQALGAGNSEMTLSFDGRILYDHMLFAPATQTFRLVAVKIYSGNVSAATLEDEVAVALTTPAYTRDQFEPPSASILEDRMENGTANWTWVSPWSLDSSVWRSSSHAWKASGTQSGALSTISLNTSSYVEPILRFNTCYQMTGSNAGYLEVSAGAGWTKVVTLTGSTHPWTFQYLDLSEYSKAPSLQLRFNASSAGSVLWYVDDVFLNGQAAVTNVSFDYAPKLVPINVSTVFTASYSSVDMSLPVTYTWDFGDGTPTVVTSSSTASHTFTAPGDHTVQLTVENPYDSVIVSQIVGAHVPVTGVSFSYTPAVPETGTTINLTAAYAPVDADMPVTYTWDLGDGSPAVVTTTATIAHSYSAGSLGYTVKVTATNGYGAAITNTLIPVKEGVTSVTFTTSDPRIEGDAVTFYPSITRETASQPVTYTWNFDDGTSQVVTTTAVVEHIFASHGSYSVQVTADNGYGTPASYNASVTINGRPVESAFFTVNQSESAGDPEETTFSATYGPSNATQPMAYTWDFGDGTIETVSDATRVHTFPDVAPGNTVTWTVWLTISNGWGSPVSYSRAVVLPFDDDGDGLSNVYERNTSHTDPQNPDSDGDNRTDGEEVMGYHYAYAGYAAGLGYPAHSGYNLDVTTDPNNPDTDGDGLWDDLEFSEGTHPRVADTDGDGLADGTEQGNGSTDPLDPDTDGDGLLDGAEVNTYHTNALDTDSDDDHVNDYAEVVADGGALSAPANTDSDALINALDADDDGDGLLTINEDLNADGDPTNDDTDSDGRPNYLDADDDGDGIPTLTEGAGNPDGDSLPNYLDPDSDGDGILDSTEGTGNPDGDSLPNYLDTDSDGDGILDSIEGVADLDSDGIPNYLDDDDDGDGVPTLTEGIGDPDSDGKPNYRDDDSDGDGIPDAGEWSTGPTDPLAGCTASSPVCFDNNVDSDGTSNYLDTDSDGDGALDMDEGLLDTDRDRIPDYLDNVTMFTVYLPLTYKNK